ncbi:MAG TPA: acyloxyacyl hydrolase [Allosphingosinicella sp.]|nr:acyloxyacyl hydrolase [Allosphingosinicella sp.]
MRIGTLLAAATLAAMAVPADAGALFTGLLIHDIDTPLSKGGLEDGVDLQFGWRGERIGALRFLGRPAPYAFASVAIGAPTHFAAAGLSWRIGSGPFYLRPAAGIAVHTRPRHVIDPNGLRGDLGSRVVFEPELGAGYRLNDRVAIEATWVHLSHAQLFGRQNPGMEAIGLRLNIALRQGRMR